MRLIIQNAIRSDHDGSIEFYLNDESHSLGVAQRLEVDIANDFIFRISCGGEAYSYHSNHGEGVYEIDFNGSVKNGLSINNCLIVFISISGEIVKCQLEKTIFKNVTSISEDWYYENCDGLRCGPYSKEELELLYQDRTISDNAKVFKDEIESNVNLQNTDFEDTQDDPTLWYYGNLFQKRIVSRRHLIEKIKIGEINFRSCVKQKDCGKWKLLQNTEFAFYAKKKKLNNRYFNIFIVCSIVYAVLFLLELFSNINLSQGYYDMLGLLFIFLLVMDVTSTQKANYKFHQGKYLMIILFAPFLYLPYRLRYINGKVKEAKIALIPTIALCILLYLSIFTSFSNSSVDLVREGSFKDYPDYTISEIFDDNLSDLEWNTQEVGDIEYVLMNGNGRNIYTNEPIPVFIKFIIENDGVSFSVEEIYIDGEEGNVYDLYAIIENFMGLN